MQPKPVMRKAVGGVIFTILILLVIIIPLVKCNQDLLEIPGRAAKYIHKPHKPDPYYDKIYGYGIDLSHHNIEPDWNKLNIDFIILKSTEGTAYVDPTFSHRALMGRKNGFHVGAYHFFSGNGNADKEFENFNRQIKGKIDIVPVIDIEKKPKNVTRKAFQSRFLKFISRIKKEYGVYPIIYTSEGFYYAYLKDLIETKLKENNEKPLLWFGDVGQAYKKYTLTPHIHQREIKNIKGVKGKVDFNELHCKIDEILLKSYQK